MAEIAAANVAVSVPSGKRDIGGVHVAKNITMAEITFGNDTLTYPTGGIPMPAIGQFGFKKAIDFVAVEQPPANGFVYKFDRANHKLKIFTQGVRTGSSTAADATSGSLAENSAAAETALRLMGTAVDTTYDLGAMIELPAAIAPAAATVGLLLIGE